MLFPCKDNIDKYKYLAGLFIGEVNCRISTFELKVKIDLLFCPIICVFSEKVFIIGFKRSEPGLVHVIVKRSIWLFKTIEVKFDFLFFNKDGNKLCSSIDISFL